MISVVVCTFRRPGLLEKHLPALCTQTLDRDAHEIIVVDNNSRDRTPDVVARLRRRHQHRHYRFEPRQGLSQARNCGWRSARGDYVAFVDDDSIVPPQWLAVAREVIEEFSPVEFGGPIHAVFDGPKPRWWRDGYDRRHSHSYAEQSGPLLEHQEIYGGNLFLLRRAIERAGGFDPSHGMSGHTPGYGEEWELHRRLCALMPEHRAWNEPRLFVHHLVRPEKLSLWWTLRERVSRSRSTHLIGCGGRPVFSLWQSLAFMVVSAKDAAGLTCRALIGRDRSAHPCWQNELYESREVQRVCDRLGQLQAQWAGAPRWLPRSRATECARCRAEAPRETSLEMANPAATPAFFRRK